MLNIDITADGPVFDGRAEMAAEDMAAAAVEAVAEVAEELAVSLMQHYFRRPRPYYWTRVTITQPAYLTARVHDQGVVYGPWLEGVGSRNRTSRFKGYWHWRQTRQEVASRVPVLVEPVVREHIERMRG